MSIIRKTRFTTALMWALVPLTVFGSAPRMGCICANGQHKLFCQRNATSDADGHCNCCYGQSTSGSKSGPATCCQCSQKACGSESPGVRAERPCRPVVHKAVYLTAARVALQLDQTEALPLSIAFEPLPVTVPDFVATIHHRELLPPPDLVVTLGVLLI